MSLQPRAIAPVSTGTALVGLVRLTSLEPSGRLADKRRGGCSNPERSACVLGPFRSSGLPAAAIAPPPHMRPQGSASGAKQGAVAWLFAPKRAATRACPHDRISCFSFQGAFCGERPPETAVHSSAARCDVVVFVHPRTRLPQPSFCLSATPARSNPRPPARRETALYPQPLVQPKCRTRIRDRPRPRPRCCHARSSTKWLCPTR